MSKYRIWEQHGLNYVTLTVVGWIDVFTRQRYRDIVIETTLLSETKGFTHCGVRSDVQSLTHGRLY
jgi:hypothetical protein